MTSETKRGYRIDYARISTVAQDEAMQQDALQCAHVDRVFTDHASGALSDRPGLQPR